MKNDKVLIGPVVYIASIKKTTGDVCLLLKTIWCSLWQRQ